MRLQNIVILCYSFPPNPGVGGRRWAKFAKYLKRLGYGVTVVTVKPNKDGRISNYTDDVVDLNIKFYGKKAPEVLSGITNTIIEKIKYRLYVYYRRLIIKGTPFDLAGLDQDKVLKALDIENKLSKIDVLIATGAPFHLTYFASLFKRQNPNVKLICDFRDPWISGGNYGIDSLSPAIFSQEKDKEKFVFESANVITVPVDDMVKSLLKLYPTFKDKLVCLPHGYDEDVINQRKNDLTQPTRIIYYGTLYQHCEVHLTWLNNVLKEANGDIIVDFFGFLNETYSEILLDSIELGFFRGNEPVIESKLFEIISHYHFVILLSRFDYGLNHIPTKYYEVIASRIPILYIGGEGEAYYFVVNNNLGIAINELSTGSTELLKKINKLHYNNLYEVENYSFASITKRLESLFD